MRTELKRRFPGTGIGGIDLLDAPLDLLDRVFFGGCARSLAFTACRSCMPYNNWPASAHQYLDNEQIARLEPPDLERAIPSSTCFWNKWEWIARRKAASKASSTGRES